ncbi:MAG: B12-binding domain-containing protein, partial [Candidatus Bathyarchaeota archaeon]|nr:B12-binding domain-containing protein [Candidatus Bathyarchaeota archaeon]
MERERILRELGEAVINFDDDLARRLAREVIDLGIDPVEALEEGLAKALREVGDRFGSGEAFITELIAAAQAMEAGA